MRQGRGGGESNPRREDKPPRNPVRPVLAVIHLRLHWYRDNNYRDSELLSDRSDRVQ